MGLSDDEYDVPSSTAGRMTLKLSSTRITSAASFATSVPLLPIDTPISAILSDSASLTAARAPNTHIRTIKQTSKNGRYLPPSPVIATMAPRAWNASTIAILCFGLVRANTLTLPTRSHSCAAVIRSSAAPVRHAPAPVVPRNPSDRATDSAVSFSPNPSPLLLLPLLMGVALAEGDGARDGTEEFRVEAASSTLP